MTVRPGGPEDAGAMARVLVCTWRERYPGLVSRDVLDGLDEEGFAAYFARELEPGTGHGAVVAADGGELAGFVHFGPDPDDAARGHVYSFYVLPEHAGAGLGRELLERALAELGAEGYGAVTLWVFRDNERTVRLYERAGFRPDGAERVEAEYRIPEQRMARELP